MNILPTINEKCRGALIAFAVGDALGWPNERRSSNIAYNKNYISSFKKWVKKSGGRYWSHNETILSGEYSDDTQLTLAVARSLLSGQKWDIYFTKYELAYWRFYERGGGSTMLRASTLWSHNTIPWKDKDNGRYFMAGGNGVAMRVIPHVIFHLRDNDFEIIANEIVEDALVSHGHPRAILGALCYAYAVYYSLSMTDTLNYGELISAVAKHVDNWGAFSKMFTEDWLNTANINYDYKAEWDNTVKSILTSLEYIDDAVQQGLLDSETETLSTLGCFDKKVNGAGDIAAVTAIYLASKYANNPILGIKQAANLFGADTDTIAAMTGGILGSLCGIDWLPYEWKTVQDYNCIDLMAECLLVENGSVILQDHIAAQTQDEMWERLPIGKAKPVSEEVISCGKTGQVIISKYLSVLGQTIYKKHYSRIEKKENKKVDTLKLNMHKLKKLLAEDSNCDVSLSTLLEILEMKNSGSTVEEISLKESLNETIIKKILSNIMT